LNESKSSHTTGLSVLLEASTTFLLVIKAQDISLTSLTSLASVKYKLKTQAVGL